MAELHTWELGGRLGMDIAGWLLFQSSPWRSLLPLAELGCPRLCCHCPLSGVTRSEVLPSQQLSHSEQFLVNLAEHKQQYGKKKKNAVESNNVQSDFYTGLELDVFMGKCFITYLKRMYLYS